MHIFLFFSKKYRTPDLHFTKTNPQINYIVKYKKKNTKNLQINLKKSNIFGHPWLKTDWGGWASTLAFFYFFGLGQHNPYELGWTQPPQLGHWSKPVTRLITVYACVNYSCMHV
jgi:hypothetical protein